MNCRWSIAFCVACFLGFRAVADWAEIPRHETRQGWEGGFELGRFEVTTVEFVDFLNDEKGFGFAETQQIAVGSDGRYAVRRGMRRQAVADVTAAEAEAYCRWLARQTGRTVRLPTEAEWEVAARAGIDGAPFSWGWGGKPSEWAQFDASGPAARGGAYPANGFGLHDMAGNLYEWCAYEVSSAKGLRCARGGGWPERDPALLRVDRAVAFPANYRGRDVGFRVLREP